MERKRDIAYITSEEQELEEKFRREATDEIIRLIRRLVQAAYLYTKELDRKYNVSAPQLNCLRVLDNDGSLPHSRLAQRIMVKSSTITGVIDRLERKSLAKKGWNGFRSKDNHHRTHAGGPEVGPERTAAHSTTNV